MLDGLLASIGLGLTGLLLSLFNFLDELLECLLQHLGSDLAALDGDGNYFGIYFVLHCRLKPPS